MLSELQLGECTGPCMEVFIDAFKVTGIGVFFRYTVKYVFL
jgi:hypothetical protein